MLEHLHAGLELGGYVLERTVPKTRLFFFIMLIYKWIPYPLIPSETQASRVCVWLACPLPSCFDHRRFDSTLRISCLVRLPPSKPTDQCRELRHLLPLDELRGDWLVVGNHLAQELVTLVTDMMLQRFFTTMLM